MVNIFVENNKFLLILFGFFPIIFFRIPWNILTYNKINKTEYIFLLHNFQKGGWGVGIYCGAIF